MVEVLGDMPLVPGDEDGFDAGEVLVERGAADAGLLCNLGHGHGPQPMPGDQGRGGLEDRLMHLAAMGLDRLMPELRDHARIRHGQLLDTLYYT